MIRRAASRNSRAARRHARLAGFLCACVCAIALPRSAVAQVALLDPPRGALERATEVDVFAGGELGADLDQGGDFNRVHTGLRFVTDGAVNRNFGIGLSAGYTYDGYDFDESSAPTCGPAEPCWEVSPWKNIHTIDIAPSASLIIGPNFQIIAWVPMRWSLESGNSAGTFTGGILAGARIVFGDGRFATTLGVGYQSEIEADGRVFPLIGFDWALSKKWRLSTEGGPYEGGLVTLLYGPSNEIKLRVSAGWERKRFRLSDAGLRHPNGIGEHENAPILAGVDIALSEAFRLEIHGGLSAGGRLTIYDRAGARLTSTKYGVAGRVGGSFEIVF